MTNIAVVKTNLIRKNFKRKDGTRQLKVLAKIGYESMNRFCELHRYEVKLLKHNQLHIVTDEEYSDLQKNISDERLRLFATRQQIKHIILRLLDAGEDISADIIHKRLYKTESTIDEKRRVTGWNNFLSQYGVEVNKAEIEEIEKEIEILREQQDFITEEDISDIAMAVPLSMQISKEQERIAKMDFNTRYQQGHFDHNNIFDVFGFLWSENPLNGDPYVPKSYKSLILQMNDYRFNAIPSQSVKNFNTEWIDGFFTYLVQEGFPDVRIKGYDPFNIQEYSERIISAERNPYKVQAFEKVVKHFKRYLSLLKEHELITYHKEVLMISAKKYLSREVTKDNYTRREFSLTPDEYNKIALTDFEDNRQNLARDMFIIMVQGGGFRTNEIFKHVKVQNNEITVYRPKIKEVVTNPIWGHLADVIDRHNGDIPKNLLPVEDFRAALKEIAIQLDFNRIITRPNTTIHNKKGDKVATEDQVEEIVIKEVFSPLFARKTIFSYLHTIKDMKDEDIMEFASIKSKRTVNHYKSRMTIVEKFKLIE